MLDRFGIIGQHFVYHGLNRAGVGDLLQAFFFDNLLNRGGGAGPHCFKRLLGQFAAQGAVGNFTDQSRQARCGDRALCQIQPFFIQRGRQFAVHPVGRELALPACQGRRFKESGLGTAGGEQARIVIAHAEIGHKALRHLARQLRHFITRFLHLAV